MSSKCNYAYGCIVNHFLYARHRNKIKKLLHSRSCKFQSVLRLTNAIILGLIIDSQLNAHAFGAIYIMRFDYLTARSTMHLLIFENSNSKGILLTQLSEWTVCLRINVWLSISLNY